MSNSYGPEKFLPDNKGVSNAGGREMLLGVNLGDKFEERTEEDENNHDLGNGVEPKRRFQDMIKKLIQANVLSGECAILKPLHQRVLQPSAPEDGQSNLRVTAISGGIPITESNALKLRETAFGKEDVFMFSSPDWFDCSFGIHDANDSNGWQLKVYKDGPSGLVMCVQAHFLKHLLFMRRRTKPNQNQELTALLKTDRRTQEDCLAHALSDVLWKAGDKQRATLCLMQDSGLEDTEEFRGDGVTEKLKIFHFRKQDDMTFCIKKYLFQFLDNESEYNNGTILLLYSLLMSKGLDKLRAEIDVPQSEAVVAVHTNGTLRKSVANLLITGRASPYFHNGVRYEGSESEMATPKTGTLMRSELGLLMWKSANSKVEVGSRLKTPSFPIWVTYCKDNYGVLFNLNKDLMRDYHAENRFELLYVSGKANSSQWTTLTISTRETKALDPYLSPILENLIQTKWNDASIEWKEGECPFI